MLELHLFIKPLTGAVFRLVLQRNPWHQKGIPLKASEILQWCDWQGFFFLGFLVHVNSGGKSGNKGWVWFIATKFPTPVTGASALLHCTFFSEKHIQLLSFKVLWLEKKKIRSPPSTLSLPPCGSHNSRGWRQEGCLCSCCPGELLGDLVNGVGKVCHVAWGDPCHRDAAILCHVDGELLGQPLHLQRGECVGASWLRGVVSPALAQHN